MYKLRVIKMNYSLIRLISWFNKVGKRTKSVAFLMRLTQHEKRKKNNSKVNFMKLIPNKESTKTSFYIRSKYY